MPWDPPIVLERMSQQCDVLGAEDDWTGLTSSASRRKAQNRINQRAYRKRKILEAKSTGPQSRPQAPQTSSFKKSSSEDLSNSSDLEAGSKGCDGPKNELWALYRSPASRSKLDQQKLSRVAAICKLDPCEQKKLVTEFKNWLERGQRMGSPRADHLLVLIKFNVFRGLISNGVDLGYAAGPGVDDDNALSPFTDPSNVMRQARSAPPALQPTKRQRQVPHHPWIDVLPSPAMRDNILMARDNTYDVMELCVDLVGSFCEESFNKDEARKGLIVWGEPWDVGGWEITLSFAKNWGWTIKGCEQLFRATNYWRERRGERPLDFERILHEEV